MKTMILDAGPRNGTRPAPIAGVPGVLDRVEEARSGGLRTLVFVSGCFNVLHPGHLRLFKFAREQGGMLVVGVLPNSLCPGAIVDETDRLEGVGAVTYVDHAFLMNQDAADTVRWLRPEVVIKGNEWAGRHNPEAVAVDEYGGRLVFGSGEMTFSSLDLIQKEFREQPRLDGRACLGYRQRHDILAGRARQVVESFAGLRVVVVGDTIVDEYIVCEALGMSQEDPVVVVRPLTTRRFVGGAGVVALHVRGLGAEVRFVSVLGEDPAGAFVREHLADQGVETCFLCDASRPTTIKQRFMCQGKKLLRVSYLREHPLRSDLVGHAAARVDEFVDGADLLIFSDFNYGVLGDPLRDRIAALCRRRGVMMAADCQSSSQIGDLGRYTGMDLITPTEREARLTLHDRESGLAVLAHRLERKMRAREVLLTLGAEGVLIHHPTGIPDMYETDRLPALNPEPKDLMGAGDSLLAGAALTLATGVDVWTATYIGSVCAALQVASYGNQSLGASQVLAFLDGAS